MAAAEGLRRDLVFVDLETTGGNAGRDRITEVGIVRRSDSGEIEEWSSLVNPERPIPEYIESFTGITNDMVASAPRFAEIAGTVRDKLAGAVFVAHNARFDYSFLRNELRKAGVSFAAPVLCTVKLSRRLFPQHARHNLDAVMERNGLTCEARHRALGDAKVIHDLWVKLKDEVPQETLAGAVESALGVYRLPPHLPPDLADDLPDSPGAYRFFGADGALLYVGRGESLRTAVCTRLALDNPDGADRRLAQEVLRVDWVESAGQLGALLRQSAWIKAGKPRHNRRPKSGGEPHTLRMRPSSGLDVLPVAGLDLTELMRCFGLFHSEKDARRALTEIAHARQLCLKILGLEEGEGSCFAFQMGKCKGACAAREPLVLHDMRTRLALSALKLKSWPFPGRIAIRERPPWGGAEEFGPAADLHVVDHWAYVGTARSDEDLETLRRQDADAAFDVDVYRILVRYLGQHPKLEWIDLRDAPLVP